MLKVQMDGVSLLHSFGLFWFVTLLTKRHCHFCLNSPNELKVILIIIYNINIHLLIWEGRNDEQNSCSICKYDREYGADG